MVDGWPLAVVLIIYLLVPLIVQPLMTLIALRGSKPKERPEILRALAELFRRGGGRGPHLPPPSSPDHRV